jgi:hypothetical protein
MLVRKLLAVFLAGNGIVWFLQGTGVFTVFPSLMNNDIRWAVAGVLAVAAALLIWPRQPNAKGE